MTHDERCERSKNVDGWCHCTKRALAQAQEEIAASHTLIRIHDACRESAEKECDALREEIARLKAVVEALMAWGVEFDDERLDYIVVQVDRSAIDAARAALVAQ
jgi:hypothetical protein